MKLFACSLFVGFALAQSSRITLPVAGSTIRAGQNITVQVTHAISTSQVGGELDVAVSIGISGCAPGAAGCPDPSKDAGRYILYTGPYSPSIHDSGSLDAYQNFTVFIPSEISGVSTIQVGRYWLETVSNQPTIPNIDYIHSIVTVQAPSGAGSYYIHPNGDSAKCVGILGGAYTNGAAVDIYDCNHSTTQKWTWNGNALTSVNPADQSQWCLDAGEPTSFANGTKLKIWQCFSGLTQQTWTPPFSLSTGGNIRLSTGGFCVDLTNGDKTNKNVLQIWACSSGFNANQVWTYEATA